MPVCPGLLCWAESLSSISLHAGLFWGPSATRILPGDCPGLALRPVQGLGLLQGAGCARQGRRLPGPPSTASSFSGLGKLAGESLSGTSCRGLFWPQRPQAIQTLRRLWLLQPSSGRVVLPLPGGAAPFLASPQRCFFMPGGHGGSASPQSQFGLVPWLLQCPFWLGHGCHPCQSGLG